MDNYKNISTRAIKLSALLEKNELFELEEIDKMLYIIQKENKQYK